MGQGDKTLVLQEKLTHMDNGLELEGLTTGFEMFYFGPLGPGKWLLLPYFPTLTFYPSSRLPLSYPMAHVCRDWRRFICFPVSLKLVTPWGML